MSDAYVHDSDVSILTVGFILLAMMVAFNAFLCLDYQGIIEMDHTTFYIVQIVISSALLFIGVAAFRNGLVPETIILGLVPILTLGFTIADLAGYDLTGASIINVVLSIALLMAAFMAYSYCDYLLAAIAVVLAIQQSMFVFFDVSSMWLVIAALEFLIAIGALVYAGINWYYLDSPYEEAIEE